MADQRFARPEIVADARHRQGARLVGAEGQPGQARLRRFALHRFSRGVGRRARALHENRQLLAGAQLARREVAFKRRDGARRLHPARAGVVEHAGEGLPAAHSGFDRLDVSAPGFGELGVFGFDERAAAQDRRVARRFGLVRLDTGSGRIAGRRVGGVASRGDLDGFSRRGGAFAGAEDQQARDQQKRPAQGGEEHQGARPAGVGEMDVET